MCAHTCMYNHMDMIFQNTAEKSTFAQMREVDFLGGNLRLL